MKFIITNFQRKKFAFLLKITIFLFNTFKTFFQINFLFKNKSLKLVDVIWALILIIFNFKYSIFKLNRYRNDIKSFSSKDLRD